VPDPLSILRLAALLIFIGLVAVGLWLLDVAWWVVPPVMAVALLIAWTIEWLAWRGTVASTVARELPVASAAPPAPPIEPEPVPPAAIVPPPAAAAPTVPEPPPAPIPEPPQPPPAPSPEPPPPAPEPAPPPPVPEPEPEPPPEPEPEQPPEPVATVSAEPTPEPPARRPRRLRLRSVPAPRPREQRPQPPPPPAPAPSTVVAFQPRTPVPRRWNLWDLERIARAAARDNPERRDEFSFLFVHLRQFADADGSLPAEFDGLVRESFGGLLDHAAGR
jgi:hypothetical protein